MSNTSRLSNSYTQHIGAVSDLQRCIAQQDIHNEFGVLLIKKGDVISAKLAQKLEEHDLDENIDHVIGLEDALTGQTLLEAFTALENTYPDLLAIQNQRGAKGVLESLCLRKPFPPVLLQKLSVMQSQLPEQFKRSLIGAWLSALLALAQQSESEYTYSVFCAALFRDLGLLHIDAGIATNADQAHTRLEPEQRRTLAAHPLLSRQIVLAENKYGEAVVNAIAEHHEHPAGIGYPSGKTCDSCSDMGLVLALSDFLCEHACENGNSFAFATVYLHAASSIYQMPIYAAAYALFKGTQFDVPELRNNSEDMAQQIVARIIAIGAVFAYLISLQHQCDLDLKPSEPKMATRFAQRIAHAIALLHSIGLSNIDLLECLDEMRMENSIAEFQETEVVQHEFLHIAEHIYRLGAKWLLKETEIDSVLKANIGSNLKLLQAVLMEVKAENSTKP